MLLVLQMVQYHNQNDPAFILPVKYHTPSEGESLSMGELVKYCLATAPPNSAAIGATPHPLFFPQPEKQSTPLRTPHVRIKSLSFYRHYPPTRFAII